MIIITIILISLIVLAVVLYNSGYNKFSYDILNVENLGIIFIFVFSVLLILHIMLWVDRPIDYNETKISRDTIQITLEYARADNKKFELASITKSVVEFNTKLALQKYYNTVPILKLYIDNRIDELKPIK